MKVQRLSVLTIVTCVALLGVSGAALVQASAFGQDSVVTGPDQALFHRATIAMQHSQYADARSLMETLITRHPDSDYVPKAKIGIANAWFAEGAYQKAELEYRDFITFFPNRPEVAEAHAKIHAIGNIGK